MKTPRYALWIAGGPLLLLLAAAAVADQVGTMQTFTPGEVADANAVNANFAAVETAVNDNYDRTELNRVDIDAQSTAIATNTADIGACETDIVTCETHIDTNATDVATNTAAIATNTSGLSGHETRIAAIETGSPVSGLDADLLDGLQANELVRAAYADSGSTQNDNWHQTSYTTLVSKSVTVPTSGILLVWASWEAGWDLDSTADTYAWLQTQITVGGTQAGVTALSEYWDNRTGLDMYNGNLHAATAVNAGTTTVALRGRIYSGSAYLFLSARSIMTLFVPFGNTGVQGTLAPTDTSDPEASGPSGPPIPWR